MKNLNFLLLVIVSSLIFATGCSNEHSNPTAGIPAINLIKIEVALNSSNSNFVDLINKIRGSVGTNGAGSKVIWSKKNHYNLGLFVAANHTYGLTTWNQLNEEYIDITEVNNGIFVGSKLPPANGNPQLTNELIASFALYHPHIPSNATNTTILPESDFYLGITDNQRIVDNGLGNYPNFVQTANPLQMYDPENRTLANPTWSVPTTNELVIAIGYPQDRNSFPNGAIATGKVYSDTEAQNIIQLLNQNNDPEGIIPYNPQVEFLAKIHALPGMSGGGIFNTDGQLLGIMIRATTLNGEPILRVIRMSYIQQKLNTFYEALPISDKNKLLPFISGELN